MLLAPAEMTAAKNQKDAAQKCFDAVGLDPDMYRIGHTKARYFILSLFYFFPLSLYLCHHSLIVPVVVFIEPFDPIRFGSSVEWTTYTFFYRCVAWFLRFHWNLDMKIFAYLPDIFANSTICWPLYFVEFCFLSEPPIFVPICIFVPISMQSSYVNPPHHIFTFLFLFLWPENDIFIKTILFQFFS